MKKELIVVIGIILISLCFAIAEDNSSINQTNLSVNTSRNWSEFCNGLNGRIDAKIKNFDDGKIAYFSGFSKIMQTVQRIKEKAISQGINTSQLDSDLLLLNQSIEQYNVDYSLFIDKLKNTKNFTCGHSQEQFVAALNESKAQLRIVKDDVDKIKELVREVIKDDVNNLRTDIKDKRMEDKNMSNGSKPNPEQMKQRLNEIRNKTLNRRGK